MRLVFYINISWAFMIYDHHICILSHLSVLVALPGAGSATFLFYFLLIYS